jgi:hypothetical protein
LPPYCPIGPATFTEQDVDFEVNFNPDVSVNSPAQSATIVTTLDAILCYPISQSSVPSVSNYTSYSSSANVLAGVSGNTVSILNVNSANDVDPFYPTGGFAAEAVDTYLGHPTPTRVYHYHVGTGCAVSTPSGNVGGCAVNANCSASIANYSIVYKHSPYYHTCSVS